VIQSVGLVKPKSGVFIDAISHILVICTNSSITLLGLAFETGANSAATGPELKLYVTDMSVQTDRVTMSGVRGTDDGRVFCKGSDGNAYEVLYQAAEGWFSAKCSVRNMSTPRFSNLVPTFLQGSRKGG
jgi:nuclear pore complex protein Nup155